MKRSGLFAVVAMILTSPPSFAQFGAMGGSGGGVGGGMGGQGTSGTIMQGGRISAGRFTELPRSAQVEMEGGKLLSGRIDLRPVVVDGDLGEYLIAPEKIKMIRFLKPMTDVKPGDAAESNNNGEAEGGPEEVAVPQKRANRGAVLRGGRGGGMMGGIGGGMAGMGGGMVGMGGGMMGGEGFGFVADSNSRSGMAMLVRGKVITTSDKEIIGTIHIPTDFKLELDFGGLTLAPAKLRSITFTDAHPKAKPAKADAAPSGAHVSTGPPALGENTSPPRYFRQGRSVIVISPVGDRATLYNLDTKKSESLELSGSTVAPLEVTPVLVENLVALMLKGPKLMQIAVADLASGTWHSQALREPIDGEAVPIVAAGIVVYKIGRDVYAYGAESQRWDVAEMPEGVTAMPSIGAGGATIESNGHIFTFAGKTGKWDHVDVRAMGAGTLLWP
jgi:hypothetical protein